VSGKKIFSWQEMAALAALKITLLKVNEVMDWPADEDLKIGKFRIRKLEE